MQSPITRNFEIELNLAPLFIKKGYPTQAPITQVLSSPIHGMQSSPEPRVAIEEVIRTRKGAEEVRAAVKPEKQIRNVDKIFERVFGTGYSLASSVPCASASAFLTGGGENPTTEPARILAR